MRKRLKKKYELGPYKKFGFDIIGKFRSDIDKDKIVDDLYDFLEQYKMSGAIGFLLYKDDFDWYIDVGTRQMNPIQQKKFVLEWLKERNDILSFEASELHDFDDRPFCP